MPSWIIIVISVNVHAGIFVLLCDYCHLLFILFHLYTVLDMGSNFTHFDQITLKLKCTTKKGKAKVSWSGMRPPPSGVLVDSLVLKRAIPRGILVSLEVQGLGRKMEDRENIGTSRSMYFILKYLSILDSPISSVSDIIVKIGISLSFE